MKTFTASMSKGASCWALTLHAENSREALELIKRDYPGLLIHELDLSVNGRVTIDQLHEGWGYEGPNLLDDVVR